MLLAPLSVSGSAVMFLANAITCYVLVHDCFGLLYDKCWMYRVGMTVSMFTNLQTDKIRKKAL